MVLTIWPKALSNVAITVGISHKQMSTRQAKCVFYICPIANANGSCGIMPWYQQVLTIATEQILQASVVSQRLSSLSKYLI